MTAEKRTRIGDWIFENIAGNYIRVYYAKTSDHAIDISAGGSDSIQLQVPFLHRILRFHIYHTDSSYASSVVSLDVQVDRKTANIGGLPKFTDILFSEENIAHDTMAEYFGEGFEFEASTWTLYLATTATHKIFPLFYIQKLGGGNSQ